MQQPVVRTVNVCVRVGTGVWEYHSTERVWRMALAAYSASAGRRVAARRAKAKLGLLLMALKAHVLADPAYTQNGYSAVEGWSQLVSERGIHRMTAARAIDEAVRSADQPVMSGEKVVAKPLCEVSRIAPLAAVLWPAFFSGKTAAFVVEREAWLKHQARAHADQISGSAGPSVPAAELPAFISRVAARLERGELSEAEAARVRRAFAVIGRLGAEREGGKNGVGAAACGALTV